MPENPSHLYEVVLVAIDSEPSRQWTAEALVDRTGLPEIDIVVALSHLTYRGQISRVDVGRYRSKMPMPQREVS